MSSYFVNCAFCGKSLGQHVFMGDISFNGVKQDSSVEPAVREHIQKVLTQSYCDDCRRAIRIARAQASGTLPDV